MLVLSTSAAAGILAPAFQKIDSESTPQKSKIQSDRGEVTNLSHTLPFPDKDIVVSTGFVSTGGKTEIWKDQKQTAVILYKPDGSVLSVFELSKKTKQTRYAESDETEFEEKYGFHQGINPILLSKLTNKILQPIGSPEAAIINDAQREVMQDITSAYLFEGIETYTQKYRDIEYKKLSFNIKKKDQAQAILDTLRIASTLYKFAPKPERVENDDTLNALNSFRKDVAKYVVTRGYNEETSGKIKDQVEAIIKDFISGDFKLKVEDMGNWIDLHAATFELLGEYTQSYQEENKKELLTRVKANPALNELIEGSDVSTEFGGYLFAQSKIHGPIICGNHVLPIANQFKMIESSEMKIASLGKKLTGISIEERKQNPSVDTNKIESFSSEAKQNILGIVEEINAVITELEIAEKVSANELLQFPSGKNLLVKLAALERRELINYDGLIKDERRTDKRIKLPRGEKGFDFSLVMNMENHKLNNLPVLLARRDSAYSLVGDEKETKDLRRKVTYTPMIILGNNTAASAVPKLSLYEVISNAVIMLEKVTPTSNKYEYEKRTKDDEGKEVVETIVAEVDVDKYIDIITNAFSENDELILGKGNISGLVKPLMMAKTKDNGEEKFGEIYETISNRAGKPYELILDAAVAPGSKAFINTLYQAKFVKYHSDTVSEQIKIIKDGMKNEEALESFIENATFPNIEFGDDISDERRTLTRRGAVSFQYLMIKMRKMQKVIMEDLYTQGAENEKAQVAFQNKLNSRALGEENRFSFFFNKAPDLQLTKSVEGVIFAVNHLKAPEQWADIQARGQETKYIHKVDKILGGFNASVFEAKHENEIARVMESGVAEYSEVMEDASEIISKVRESQLKNSANGTGEEKTERRTQVLEGGLENMRLSMGETSKEDRKENPSEEIEATEETTPPVKKRVKKVKEENIDYDALSREAATDIPLSSEDADAAATIAALEIGTEDLDGVDSSIFFDDDELTED